MGEEMPCTASRTFLILFLLVTPALGNVGCQIACRKCREGKEYPALVEVYCDMCAECEQSRRMMYDWGPNDGRRTNDDSNATKPTGTDNRSSTVCYTNQQSTSSTTRMILNETEPTRKINILPPLLGPLRDRKLPNEIEMDLFRKMNSLYPLQNSMRDQRLPDGIEMDIINKMNQLYPMSMGQVYPMQYMQQPVLNPMAQMGAMQPMMVRSMLQMQPEISMSNMPQMSQVAQVPQVPQMPQMPLMQQMPQIPLEAMKQVPLAAMRPLSNPFFNRFQEINWVPNNFTYIPYLKATMSTKLLLSTQEKPKTTTILTTKAYSSSESAERYESSGKNMFTEKTKQARTRLPPYVRHFIENHDLKSRQGRNSLLHKWSQNVQDN